MGDEPFEVAQSRAGQAECTDADDGDGQREDRRLFGGAGDQPG
ncbi:hypothetical protein KIPE111705_35325 [Kibdelosporangium persicum]